MSLSIGIVGLPNVGKSTLFNILTKNEILAANYPFATIEPNSGIVPVPDQRLNVLQQIYGASKIIPATVEFIDIAGLVAGASKGEGLGNQFLANIRNTSAIIHLVRAFDDDNIIHVNNQINPAGDIEVINTELILADLASIEKQLAKLAKEAKANPKLRTKLDLLNHIKTELESGKTINQLDIDHDEIKDLNLLTAKPVIYVFNLSEADLTNDAKKAELSALVAPAKANFIAIKLEDELRTLPDDEAKELLESYGVSEGGLAQLIHSAYDLLGLQSYLTAGPKEIHAWTIKQGSTAPQAAGVIHSDFERGFIAAQIVDYDDLVAFGSEQKAKEAGKIRTEGKDYIMHPGDVVEFRFNV
jgi:ferrous iron transport protein B